MTDTKITHTPGPWLALPARPNRSVGIVSDNVTRTVAQTYGGNREANAALIAAAPDLLDCCKRIAASPYGVALGDLVILNAAIAKAEGR